eukprot:GHVO01052426.1.p1 GENE.GHVO01052426.1~~GHVO01052426.1.p1  ORF type:complete len:159 (-),score=25.73 GHVO01052426.1:472-948(-)
MFSKLFKRSQTKSQTASRDLVNTEPKEQPNAVVVTKDGEELSVNKGAKGGKKQLTPKPGEKPKAASAYRNVIRKEPENETINLPTPVKDKRQSASSAAAAVLSFSDTDSENDEDDDTNRSCGQTPDKKFQGIAGPAKSFKTLEKQANTTKSEAKVYFQ